MFHTNPTALEVFVECCKIYGADYAKTIVEPVVSSIAAAPASFAVSRNSLLQYRFLLFFSSILHLTA